jgi:hypothetical protein
MGELLPSEADLAELVDSMPIRLDRQVDPLRQEIGVRVYPGWFGWGRLGGSVEMLPPAPRQRSQGLSRQISMGGWGEVGGGG